MSINNNAVININYGILQHQILLYKITMGTWKNFFKMYTQFGHAPPKRFVNTTLDYKT
jgi:hypothetical protein